MCGVARPRGELMHRAPEAVPPALPLSAVEAPARSPSAVLAADLNVTREQARAILVDDSNPTEEPVRRSKLRILCVDGGGIRGLVPVIILQRIEAVTGRKVHELFDIICGTSTGGLVALGAGCSKVLKQTSPRLDTETLTLGLNVNFCSIVSPQRCSCSRKINVVQMFKHCSVSNLCLHLIASSHISD